jgi:Raf kinase inhibitor-like YbhB/YbcL family protein
LVAVVACAGRSTERTLPEATSEGAGGDAPDTGAQAAFALESSAFSDRGFMSGLYVCGATAVSPPLSWTAGPSGTQSYAVVMVGPDQSGVADAYHWVIWNIPATTTDLPEGVAQLTMPPDPAGSSQLATGVDGSMWPGYAGPCPSLPGTPYTFTVYALKVATLPGVTSASTTAQVVAAIQANMLESAELTGLATHYRS